MVSNQTLIGAFGNYVANRPFCITAQDSGKTTILYMNGLMSGSSNKQITVTQYSTPDGTKVSDHAYVEPAQWQCTLLCGDDFTTSPILKETLGNDSLETIGKSDVKNLFKTWSDNAYRLSIQTYEDHYDNMVITNISHPEGEQLGVYKPTISFQEVRVATITTKKFAASKLELANDTPETDAGADNGTSTLMPSKLEKAALITGGVATAVNIASTVLSFAPPPVGTIARAAKGISFVVGKCSAVAAAGSWLARQANKVADKIFG